MPESDDTPQSSPKRQEQFCEVDEFTFQWNEDAKCFIPVLQKREKAVDEILDMMRREAIAAWRMASNHDQ